MVFHIFGIFVTCVVILRSRSKITRSQIEGSSDWYFIKRYLILAITSRMSLRLRCIVLPTFRRGWLRGHLHRLSSTSSSFPGIADISHRYFALDWPSRCICKLHLKLINTLQFWSISTMIDILRSFTKETIANLHHIYLLLTCCSFDERHFPADRISSSAFKGIFLDHAKTFRRKTWLAN